MVALSQSTKSISAKSIQRKWHLIDVSGKILGREAVAIAQLLMGKSKVNYVPYLDNGDSVVVINAKQVEVTGKKRDEKEYDSYSGYPGGRSTTTFKRLIERKPDAVIRNAVAGMLPKNKLRQKRLARLFIYSDDKHPYGNKFSS